MPAPAVKPIDDVDDAEPPPADDTVARSGETLRQSDWRDELLRTGIRGKAGQFVRFARLEPLPDCRNLHADGETLPNDAGADSVAEGAARRAQRVVVSFGPDHAPLEQRQVNQALQEAETLRPSPKVIVFAAFQFDPEAAKDIDETNWPGITLLKAQMNADLLTEDLKKKRASNESFWLIGQPDVLLHQIRRGQNTGKWQVAVQGFDYYNTKTGGVESGGEDKVAMWMLDTDYDGRSLYPRQVFFPMAGQRDGWARLARNLKAEIDEDLIEAYRGTVSLPFEAGEHQQIAVKIVDDRGIESLRVMGFVRVAEMAGVQKGRAIERLQRALDAIPQLQSDNRLTGSGEFKKWRRNTEIAIANTFGEEPRHVSDFKRVSYIPGVVSWGGGRHTDYRGPYVRGLDSASSVLQSMIDEIREYWEEDDRPATGTVDEDRLQAASNEVFIVHGRDRWREADYGQIPRTVGAIADHPA